MTGNMFYLEFNMTRFRISDLSFSVKRSMFKLVLLKTEHGVDTNRMHIRIVQET